MLRSPNFNSLGLSSPMGPKLRKLVEKQLADDLKNYGVQINDVKFDWSESCIEGHDLDYLDGSLENYSEIFIYDETDNPIAEGWMDFILADTLIVYWDSLSVWNTNTQNYENKKDFGIPEHIWVRLSEKLRIDIENKKLHNIR